MSLLGLPYAILLGVLAGLLELVPMFGPILSAVAALLVALFLPFPTVCGCSCSSSASSRSRTTSWRRASAAMRWACVRWVPCLRGWPVSSSRALSAGVFAVPIAGLLWVLIGAAYQNAVVVPAALRRWPLPPLRRRAPVQTDITPHSTQAQIGTAKERARPPGGMCTERQDEYEGYG